MSNKPHRESVSWQVIVEQDALFEKLQGSRYEEEIKHFKRMSELYISLFSNSKRINREGDGVDYVQLIAVGIFQDIRASFILTLKGLYPQAGSLLRGVLESINLIYDFILNPSHEDLWFNASKNKRENFFKANIVRERIAKSNSKSLEASKMLYRLLSDYSIHRNMESHLWYIETKDKKLFYHWAGHEGQKRSEALIFSALMALAEALFFLTYEGAYALDRLWVDDFQEWKAEHLVFIKKFGKIFGDNSVEELELKKDVTIYGY